MSWYPSIIRIRRKCTRVKGVQFKELFSIGFTYTFGQAKK